MIRWIFELARWSALFGGVVLCAITLMSVSSITGRAMVSLGLGPVPGDFELVEAGTAVAVFFFMPLCYLRSGHATVDLLSAYLPAVAQWLVETLSDLLMLVLWVTLTWKLYEGLLEKRAFFESTYILQLPLWWAYAVCLVGATVGCLAYLAKAAIQVNLAAWPDHWTNTTLGVH